MKTALEAELVSYALMNKCVQMCLMLTQELYILIRSTNYIM